MPDGKKRIIWEDIEYEYINGEMNLRELAEKWQIGYDTIRRRAGRDKWNEKRQEIEYSHSISRIASVTDMLLIRIGETVDKGELDAKDYKALSSAVKEIGEVKERFEQGVKPDSAGIKVELSKELQELSQ